MIFLNYKHSKFNIAHFQGKSSEMFSRYLYDINKSHLELPDDITILSVWTDSQKSILKQQLDANNIPVTNCFLKSDEVWHNPLKIKFLVDTLKEVGTKYVLILDAYDVAINSFENIAHKFLKMNCGVVFNASKNNFPPFYEDITYSNASNFRFLNAGCCFGYTQETLRFYNEIYCKYLEEPDNKWHSEQLIVRRAFVPYKNYGENYNLVKLDTECDIFQTFGQACFKNRGDYILVY